MKVDDVVLAELLKHFNLSHRRLLHYLVVIGLLELLDRNCQQRPNTNVKQAGEEGLKDADCVL